MTQVGINTIRVLVAKPGLDGHDRGAKVIARALRDAGMEVIYTGIRQTPEMIAEASLQGRRGRRRHQHPQRRTHGALAPYHQRDEDRGIDDRLVLAGGIIPEDDIAPLKEMGVGEVFGPGTSTTDIIDYIKNHQAEASNQA